MYQFNFETCASSIKSNLKCLPFVTTLTITLSLIFLLIDFLINDVMFKHNVLNTGALFKFEINRLLLYPLINANIEQFFFNNIMIYIPLLFFEKNGGSIYTLYTMSIMNLLSAVFFCLVGKLFNQNTLYNGISGLFLGFVAHYSFSEYKYRKNSDFFKLSERNFSVLLLFIPLALLIVSTIFLNNFYFMGNFFGVFTGYLHGMGFLSYLYPSLMIFSVIEAKCDFIIKKIKFLTFYRESDCVNNRISNYVSLFDNHYNATVNDFVDDSI